MRSSLRTLKREHGGALVEVMMAAMLVALAATAVFKGIDGAAAVSSGSKSRAIAAAVAQDDQERLRATAPQSLVDINQNNNVTRSGVVFKVNSKAKWVADRDATPDCNSTTSRAGYLRIISTVTWPDMRGSKPVVAASLVAPPNGTVTSNRGALGIKVLNGSDQPVQGASVDVAGAGLSGATDSNGCVYWDDIPEGNYSYTASKTGLVDPNGNVTAAGPAGVAGGQTRIVTAYLDAAQTVNFEFRTKDYSGADASLAAFSGQLNLSSSKLTATAGVKSWAFTGATSRQVTGLFPTQYGAYLGPCPMENNAAEYGASDPAMVVDPVFANPEVVYKAPLKLRVTYGGNAGQNGVSLKIVQKQLPGGGCSRTYTTALDAALTTSTQASVAGRLAKDVAALPYGTYAVCAQLTSGSSIRRAMIGDTGVTTVATGDVQHKAILGTTVNLDIPNTGSQGNCP